MTMWMAGAAIAVGTATTLYSQNSAQNSAIKNGNAISKANGAAIVKERMNMNIRNSYETAISQMNLSLTKRRLAQQGGAVSAAGLAAHGDADIAAASTGSIGASVQAVQSDIQNKVDAATEETNAAYELAVQNYNTDLDMMVLNTAQSEPTMQKTKDNTQSTGSMVGVGLLSGIGQFASQYASQRMKLGLGQSPVSSVPSTIKYNNSSIFSGGVNTA